MKFYIAGKITGNPDYKEQFAEAERGLKEKGHSVMNPAWIQEGAEFTWSDYMMVTSEMQMVCEAVLFLENWTESKGAQWEFLVANKVNQKQFFCLDDVPLKKS